MPLANDRFDPASSSRADPDRYLILGFDTEYQRCVDQPELHQFIIEHQFYNELC